MAAASSFYVLLSVIPATLIFTRMLGLFIDNPTAIQDQLISIGYRFVPQLFEGPESELFPHLKKLIFSPFFGPIKFTWINIGIFLWASYAFLNSIWTGLFFLTNEKSSKEIWQYLKGLVIIVVTVIILIFIITIPSTIYLLENILKNSSIINFITKAMPSFSQFLMTSYSENRYLLSILNFELLHMLILLAYCTFLYRWFFSSKITIRTALIGSLTFISSLIIGKKIFILYVIYVKSGLISAYGSFYTILMSALWIFLMACMFFYGACICHTLHFKKH